MCQRNVSDDCDEKWVLYGRGFQPGENSPGFKWGYFFLFLFTEFGAHHECLISLKKLLVYNVAPYFLHKKTDCKNLHYTQVYMVFEMQLLCQS